MREARPEAAQRLSDLVRLCEQALGGLELSLHRMQEGEGLEDPNSRNRAPLDDHTELLAAADRLVDRSGSLGSAHRAPADQLEPLALRTGATSMFGRAHPGFVRVGHPARDPGNLAAEEPRPGRTVMIVFSVEDRENFLGHAIGSCRPRLQIRFEAYELAFDLRPRQQARLGSSLDCLVQHPGGVAQAACVIESGTEYRQQLASSPRIRCEHRFRALEQPSSRGGITAQPCGVGSRRQPFDRRGGHGSLPVAHRAQRREVLVGLAQVEADGVVAGSR